MRDNLIFVKKPEKCKKYNVCIWGELWRSGVMKAMLMFKKRPERREENRKGEGGDFPEAPAKVLELVICSSTFGKPSPSSLWRLSGESCCMDYSQRARTRIPPTPKTPPTLHEELTLGQFHHLWPSEEPLIKPDLEERSSVCS